MREKRFMEQKREEYEQIEKILRGESDEI